MELTWSVYLMLALAFIAGMVTGLNYGYRLGTRYLRKQLADTAWLARPSGEVE